MPHELTEVVSDSLQPFLGASTPAFGPALFRAGVALLVVILLVVGVAAVYRRWLARGGQRVGGGSIRVVNSVPVGRRSSLLLVEVDDRRILIGSTATSLSALSEWEDVPDGPEVTTPANGTGKAMGFEPLLDRVLSKLKSLEARPR